LKSQNVLEILNWATALFESTQIENPKLNTEQIISHVLDVKRLELYLHSSDVISEDEIKEIQSLIERRRKGEPLQYVLGETFFYDCWIFIDKNVLIPRPETELLVEKVIDEHQKVKSILEIGTGSGAIAIALAKNLNLDRIDAIDISNEAIKLARKNAIENSVNINFYQSDIFENIKGKFELIVSNPPYISGKEYEKLPAEIKNYEPINALLASENGLIFYKKILKNAKEYLTKNGKIYFEIGYDQAERIKEIANKNSFDKVNVFKDLNGFDRIIKIG